MAEGNPRTFWKTAGALGIVTAVITLTGTIVVALINKPSTPSAQSTSSSAEPPASVTSGSAAPPSSTAAAPLWSGHLNLESYVNFDVLPPVNGGGQLSQATDGSFRLSGNGAIWESPNPPTKQECIDRIAGYSVTKFQADIGKQLCYKARSGRIVHIKFTELVQPGNVLDTPLWGTEITIWSS
ncbi:hypothetical protein [Lentzea flava]|uniref:Serine/threonine protein kinase n=1 Tax=Lentzea flava TaxID=103732 RepID=A0ABQ2VJC4_9PSEU|nr:hypothetical protein [Lentzea flava]MCP2197822.1 hypothetical protein [Lentzea flava]GGU87019.1 hypothetical protein GCM10010178_91130 [Lentzea flava]